jgi:hypothetical protein
MIEHMNALLLKQPTPALVVEHVELFNLGDPGLTDQTLTRLLSAFPDNRDESAVLLKATTINSLYATNIYAIFQVARHIHALNIDPKLVQGSLEVIEDIAVITLNRKRKRNYSFATKYCGWHRPDVYPIYDSYVDRLLWTYRQQDRFADFKQGELRHYPRYKEVIEQFRTYYGLDQFSFKELDKFLWRYGKEVLRPEIKLIPPTEEAHEYPTHHQLGSQNI